MRMGSTRSRIPISIISEQNHGNFTFQLQVLEWNGFIFRELLSDPYTDATTPGTAAFRDVDGNGTLEILFPHDYWGEQGGGVDCEIGPDLNFEDIWMWDGEYYHYMRRQNADPIYRFQAAYDGDYFVSLGLFDRSERMYLRAAFDKSLKPGSTGDWMRDGECYGSNEIKPDPTELARIKAYARFRLAELYVHLGRVMEAESHRTYLRTNYPLGVPGYIYAYLANTFWWEYVKDSDITAACAAVRGEAEKNSKPMCSALFENYGYGNSRTDFGYYLPIHFPSRNDHAPRRFRIRPARGVHRPIPARAAQFLAADGARPRDRRDPAFHIPRYRGISRARRPAGVQRHARDPGPPVCIQKRNGRQGGDPPPAAPGTANVGGAGGRKARASRHAT